jgi:hypothetical protein
VRMILRVRVMRATKERSGKDKRPLAPCLPIVQILSSSSQLHPPLLSRCL